MKRSYTYFNILCLGFISGFAFATLWFWRGEIQAAFFEKQVGDSVPVVTREEIEETKKQRNEEMEETNEDTDETDTPETLATSTPNNGTIEQSDNETEGGDEATIPEDSDDNLEEQLPPSINLAVPFTSQAPEKNWDQPWQDACEEAAVLMLDAYYKGYRLSPLFAKDELWKMVKWEEERDWGGSIEIEKVAEVLRFYSGEQDETGNWKLEIGDIRIIENPSVEQIKRFIADGHPVLVVADGKTLPNPNFRNGGPVYHALIIRGYTETEFITNDPGTQFGENFKYKYDDLMKSIRDWNGGNVKGGRKVILVLE